MRRRAFTLGLAAGAISVISGCGGGSSGGGKVFLKDVSGTWNDVSGQLNGATLTLVQSGNALSGTLVGGGGGFTVSLAGTKDGNNVELSGSMKTSSGTANLTLHLTLVSESQMSGQFAASGGGMSISVIVTFVKVG